VKQRCSYCGSDGHCPHLLLLVDQTFRTAEGGALMQAFNRRWGRMCEEGGDDFDERDHFDELLAEVDDLADDSTEYDHEGGPGGSSSYAIYYAKSAEHRARAVARFGKGAAK
jgi:hypothetical protein